MDNTFLRKVAMNTHEWGPKQFLDYFAKFLHKE